MPQQLHRETRLHAVSLQERRPGVAECVKVGIPSDSPPMLGVSDASILASEVDQTIIVVQHRRFPRAMLTRVKQAIIGVGGNVLSVVLNNVDLKHDQNYYYYTSYYGYYQSRENQPGRPSRKAATTVASNNGDHRGADSDEY